MTPFCKHQTIRFVEELCQYVRFPSVSAQPAHRADMASCAEWLVKHCQEIGLEAEVRPTAGHPVVVAKTKRTGKPPYLVYGHYDVQPAEPFELWKSPPFEPRLEGRIFSRAARATTRAKTSPT
jgi:acetylornithine deacetylase/succinyl-diaminopimelate desuccinylase-like protein